MLIFKIHSGLKMVKQLRIEAFDFYLVFRYFSCFPKYRRNNLTLYAMEYIEY
jgi:hypothetical protein